MYIVKTSSNLDSVITPRKLIEQVVFNNISNIVIANNNSSDWIEIQREKKKSHSNVNIIFSLRKRTKNGIEIIWLLKDDALRSASLVEGISRNDNYSLISSVEALPMLVLNENVDPALFKNTYKEIFKEVGDAYIGVSSKLRDNVLESFDIKAGPKVIHFQEVEYLTPLEKEYSDVIKKYRGENVNENDFDSFLKPEKYLSKDIKASKTFFDSIKSRFIIDREFKSYYWDIEKVEAQPTNVDWKRFFLGDFKLPEEEYARKKIYLLCKVAGEGFNQRFKHLPAGSRRKYLDRLKSELTTVVNGKFFDYFLIIWDIAKHGRERGFRMGARGSVMASLLAYCLEITDLDPIEYDLIFERFLNPFRKGRPDIDLEVPAENQEEIFKYIKDKYGQDQTARMISNNAFGFRNALGTIRRTLGIQEEVEKDFTNMGESFNSFKKTARGRKAVRDAQKSGFGHLLQMAEDMQYLPQSRSVQTASIIIDEKLRRLPMKVVGGQNVLSLFHNNNDLFHLGLDKIDVLSSRNLEVLGRAWRYVGEEGRKHFNLEDRKTFELLSKGNKDFLFQLRSPGIQKAFEEIKPESIQEIMVGLSLFRPGPIKEIKNYVRNKRNGDFKIYSLSGNEISGSEDLRPILEETRGIIVYQEQIMQLVSAWAGYTEVEADIFRDIISNQKDQLMRKEKVKFLKKSREKGRADESTAELFKLIERFSKYGFAKSHAASYALLTYESAYLKANHPVHYYLALLNSNLTGTPRYKENERIIKSMEAEGIKIGSPSFLESNGLYRFRDGKLIPGLLSMKGLPKVDVKRILKTQLSLKKTKPGGKDVEAIVKSLQEDLSAQAKNILSKNSFFK